MWGKDVVRACEWGEYKEEGNERKTEFELNIEHMIVKIIFIIV